LTAASVAIAALYGAPAGAQQAPASGTTELQEIVVTGSLIKRTDTETPSPVTVVSQQDLLNSGYTTVSDVLRNLAANGAGTLSQNFPQAFASGGSGVALRGLSVGDTLTLIDGQRMVAYPLSDDGQRSFVDVTSIPFTAIDSVEVLKDGASAAYGADAIAGVVNVKLKKTYQGAEFTAEGGESQKGDGATEHLGGIAGMGDLASDGYNVYLTIDYRHQDQILANSRDGAFTDLNWSSLPGGINTNPGAIGAANLVYPDSITGYLINPTAGAGPYYLPGCTAAKQAADQCTFPFARAQIQTPTRQTDVLSKYTKDLFSDWQLTVTGSRFESLAEQVSPQGGFGHVYFNSGQENGSIENVVFSPGQLPFGLAYPVLSLPASSQLNPFGKPANLVYSFSDVGPFITTVDTTTYRLFADMQGKAWGWDIDGSAGAMYASEKEDYLGLPFPGIVQQDLNNGSYVPGVSTNGQQLFAPVASTTQSSTLDVVDLTGTRELFQMPGGPMSMALGAQYFHKAQNATQPESIASGAQVGIVAFTVGAQDDTAGFLEFDGKPFSQLETQAAIRYDHYNTYGGQETPKFGVKYQPFNMLALRGTWGKGFRAPSISESGTAGTAFGLGNTSDPVLCANGVNQKGSFNALCSYPGVGVEAANPHLKAVTSTNATLGVIFEPLQQFNLSADWYYVRLNNDIWTGAELGGLGQYSTIVRGPPATLLQCTASVTTGTCPQTLAVTPVGYPAYLTFPYLNAATVTTEGFDLDMRGRFDLGDFGNLTADINYTYIHEYNIVTGDNTYVLAGTHGPSGVSGDTGNPKQRATASVTWEQGPWTSTLSMYWISSFSVVDPSLGYSPCLFALQTRGDSAYGPAILPSVTSLPSVWNQYCAVQHFTDFNLYARYKATDHLSVHASITNLLNSPPPVDLETYGGGGGLAYNPALDQDGAIGRFFLAGFTFKF